MTGRSEADERQRVLLDRRRITPVVTATRRLLVGDLASDAARQAALDVLARADPQLVLDVWRWYGVEALATLRCREAGLTQLLWSVAAAASQDASRAAGGRQLEEARAVVELLEGARIPCAVLKGPMLAERLHGDIGLRRASADLDVLVPTEQLWPAAEVLQRSGWTAPSDILGPEGLPDLHLVLSPPGPHAHPVELHWRLDRFDGRGSCSGLLARAQRLQGVPVIADGDLAAMLLKVHARDGLQDLRLAADLAAAQRLGAPKGHSSDGSSDARACFRDRRSTVAARERPLERAADAWSSSCVPGRDQSLAGRLAEQATPTTEPEARARLLLAQLSLGGIGSARAVTAHIWPLLGEQATAHPRLRPLTRVVSALRLLALVMRERLALA